MTDLTRLKKYNEKKTHSVASAEVTHDQVSGTTLQELFNLPERCLITDAYVVVEEAGQANLTVDFGFAGGAELINDADIDAVSVLTARSTAVSGNAETITPGLELATGTGKNVTAKFSADPTAGKFIFIVEFIEYTLGNGKLMKYTPEA